MRYDVGFFKVMDRIRQVEVFPMYDWNSVINVGSTVLGRLILTLMKGEVDACEACCAT
jgi:hypothetical protein